MNDEFKLTSDVVVVKFIEVASWHKRAWDFGRENIIIISFHKKYHFFSLLFINYYFLHCLGLPCFNSSSNERGNRSRKRIYTMQKVYDESKQHKLIFYLFMFIVYSTANKNNVGGLCNSNNSFFSWGRFISIKSVLYIIFFSVVRSIILSSSLPCLFFVQIYIILQDKR